MQTITELASGKAGPEILSPLMEDGQDPGPGALVYRNSGVMAVRDALASNYPSLQMIMGEEFFDTMARSFTDAHPPTRRSLVGYGEALPGFISDASGEHGLPWLSDLARLDYAWLAAHLAASANEYTAESFASLATDPEALTETKLALIPSVRLITTGWQLHELWQKLREGDKVESEIELAPATETVLIWRLDNEVRNRVLSSAEISFLTNLQGGSTLGVAAEAALASDTEIDIGALLAASVTAGLFKK